MGLSTIEKDAEIAMVFIDLPDHQLQEIGVVCFIFLLCKFILFCNEIFLIDFDQEEY